MRALIDTIVVLPLYIIQKRVKYFQFNSNLGPFLENLHGGLSFKFNFLSFGIQYVLLCGLLVKKPLMDSSLFSLFAHAPACIIYQTKGNWIKKISNTLIFQKWPYIQNNFAVHFQIFFQPKKFNHIGLYFVFIASHYNGKLWRCC